MCIYNYTQSIINHKNVVCSLKAKNGMYNNASQQKSLQIRSNTDPSMFRLNIKMDTSTL